MLGRLPQGRRPREGEPTDQARHDDALRPALRKPRLTTEAHTAQPEYRWRMPADWWARQRHYFLYVVREFTALPLALWLLWLLVEIKRAGDGPGRYAPHGSAPFVIFSVVVLLFSLYHSFTFLSLAVSILHFKLLDRRVSARGVGISQLAACAVARGRVVSFL